MRKATYVTPEFGCMNSLQLTFTVNTVFRNKTFIIILLLETILYTIEYIIESLQMILNIKTQLYILFALLIITQIRNTLFISQIMIQ
jgi:hypothetical protein